MRIRLAVCRARVEELHTAFSDAAREVSDTRATELKLALVTALALIDNVTAADMYGSAAVISSLRYLPAPKNTMRISGEKGGFENNTKSVLTYSSAVRS